MLKSWIQALVSILEHFGTFWLRHFFKIQYVLQNGVSWKGWNLKTSHFPCTVIYFLEVVIVYEHFTKWKGCSMFLLADMTEVLTQKRSSCQLALYCICIYKKMTWTLCWIFLKIDVTFRFLDLIYLPAPFYLPIHSLTPGMIILDAIEDGWMMIHFMKSCSRRKMSSTITVSSRITLLTSVGFIQKEIL